MTDRALLLFAPVNGCVMQAWVLRCGLAVVIGAGPVFLPGQCLNAWANPDTTAGSLGSHGSVSQVEVKVRVVKADNEENHAGRAVDARLGDLQSKLERLPFHRFSVLSTESLVIPIKRKQTMTLASGQTLTLRPVYCEQEKIGLWLRWAEKNGDEILDTRLHVNPGESMIAGTDSSPSSGLILAIDVEPVSPP